MGALAVTSASRLSLVLVLGRGPGLRRSLRQAEVSHFAQRLGTWRAVQTWPQFRQVHCHTLRRLRFAVMARVFSAYRATVNTPAEYQYSRAFRLMRVLLTNSCD